MSQNPEASHQSRSSIHHEPKFSLEQSISKLLHANYRQIAHQVQRDLVCAETSVPFGQPENGKNVNRFGSPLVSARFVLYGSTAFPCFRQDPLQVPGSSAFRLHVDAIQKCRISMYPPARARRRGLDSRGSGPTGVATVCRSQALENSRCVLSSLFHQTRSFLKLPLWLLSAKTVV